MEDFRIRKMFCIFALFCISLQPIKINAQSYTEELQEKLPSEYQDCLATGSTVLEGIWNSHSMQISKANDAITIIYSGPYTKGWLGIGFSKDGHMVGSSAMVGWIGEDGKPNIKQYSMEGTTPSKVIPDKGNLQLTNVTPLSLAIRDSLFLAFQVKFPPENMKQKVLFATSPDPPINNATLNHHQEKTVTEIDFEEGQVNSFSLRKAGHGVLGILAWQVTIPLGILFPIYFKHLEPQWFYLHLPFQLIGYVLAMFTTFLGLQLSFKLDMQITWHKYFGVFALVLSSIQVLALFVRPSKETRARNWWRICHRCIGYVAAFIGFFNVYMGIRMADAGLGWMIVFLSILIFYGTLFLTLSGRVDEEDEEDPNPPPVFQLLMKRG